MAFVTSPDGQKQKNVKNLGWLLRHWQEVERFEVVPPAARYLIEHGTERYPVTPPADPNAVALLVAWLKDGRVYATHFNACSVLLDFLARPVFEGAPLLWFSLETKCGQRATSYNA